MRIPDRIRRQGFVGALSGLGPIAVAGVATAGVFRNEIADIVQDLASNYRCIRLKNNIFYDVKKCISCPNTRFIWFLFIFSLCDIVDPTTTTTTAKTTTASTLILSKTSIYVQRNITILYPYINASFYIF